VPLLVAAAEKSEVKILMSSINSNIVDARYEIFKNLAALTILIADELINRRKNISETKHT